MIKHGIVVGTILLLGYFGPIGSALAAHDVCADCHIRGRALKNSNVNELCVSCHPENVKDHVLDVVSKTAPAGLPLDNNNRITCVTCHEAHDRTAHPNMLRLEPGRICVPCHPR